MSYLDPLEPRLMFAAVPRGFTDTPVATGLRVPSALALAPDGRVFVAEQSGALRVIKNNTLLPTPFITLNVDSRGERGLLGVALDPNFATNKFVYVYHTVRGGTNVPAHNRVSRFTAGGDTALAGSQKILLDLDNLSARTNHNGGPLAFGPDGKLYIGVGENANTANAQSKSNLLGKILRINPDGSIPTDNPFVSSTTGRNKAIWATGLRNPFSMAFNFARRGGRFYFNDVGQATFEEINEGVAGSNYGWPATEGPTTRRGIRAPIFSYGHGQGPTTGDAIVGAAFYVPASRTFPKNYKGDYFFADLTSGWIRRLDPVTKETANFARNITFPVALAAARDGALYYLARGAGTDTGILSRIQFTANGASRLPATTAPAQIFSTTAINTKMDDGGWQMEEDEDAASSSILHLPSSILAFPPKHAR
jgi:glucose/arabinose dehydrogenase